jgi:hypothetical protein
MILGIDASTSVIAFCLLDHNNIIKISHIVLSDIGSIYKKYDLIEKELKEYSRYKIKNIVIEAAIKSSNSGSSNNTIIELQRFNSAVCLLCYQIFGLEPELVSSQSARARQKIVIPPIPDEVSDYERKKMIKGIMIDFCLSEQDVNKLGFEKTIHGNWAIWCGDRADSYILAKYKLGK